MGKRELFIILGFVVVGVVVYQLSAPPAEDATRGFSLSTFIDRFRRQVRGNSASASVTTQQTIAISKNLSETRISGIAHLKIVGEDRQDIEYSLTVESNGPDEATARDFASRAKLTEDNLGPVLALRLNYPREMRQVASLSVRVPSRLRVRVEGGPGGSSLEVSGVADVQLDAVVGDVRVKEVAGQVTGNHRNGDLSIADAQGATLVLVSSKATFDKIRGQLTLNARNGRCRITGSAGPIDFEGTNEDISVTASTGTLRVRGTGGSVAIDDPRSEVNVDVRRAAIDVTIARAVPVTILTTDAPLRVRLTGPPPIALDTVATDGGTIDAGDFRLTPETVDTESRVRHAFGAGVAAVALRNRRAAIVISETK
jgi:hypothetical protein